MHAHMIYEWRCATRPARARLHAVRVRTNRTRYRYCTVLYMYYISTMPALAARAGAAVLHPAPML